MKKNYFGHYIKLGTWQEARAIIAGYDNNMNRHIETNEGSRIKLKGFIFPKSELLSIINQVGTVDVYFAIGYHERPNPDEGNPIGYTLIAVGIDQNNNLINHDGAEIYDYCNPCPPGNPAD